MTKLTMTKRTISLECENETDAAHVHAALTSKQWVRMVNGGIQIADMGPEPQMSDHERLIAGSCAPCFPIPDGKTPVPVQRTKAPEHERYLPECYVQHIGAGFRKEFYAKAFKLMVSIGFVVLRSPKGPDGKHWEIWYLYGMSALTGPLKGADRQTLVKWLYQNVAPGNVCFDGESWALTCE